MSVITDPSELYMVEQTMLAFVVEDIDALAVEIVDR